MVDLKVFLTAALLALTKEGWSVVSWVVLRVNLTVCLMAAVRAARKVSSRVVTKAATMA